MRLRLQEIPAALKTAAAQGVSMRRRLVGYLSAIMLFLALFLVMLLLLSGLIDPVSAETQRALARQLESAADSIKRQCDNQAAYAAELSRQLTAALREELSDVGISFVGLRNDPDALTAVQNRLFDAVYSSMLRVPCSGAFCFLNTTVNDALPQKSYQGIYLKFANLYAENTVQNDVCLFRGFASVARANGINLYSTWQLETQEGLFPEAEAMMREEGGNPAEAYLLTRVYPLPDSWETVRLLCVPVLDLGGQVIGVCGFEISSLYFKLLNQTPQAEQLNLVCALLDREKAGLTGQASGNQSGYFSSAHIPFTVDEKGEVATFYGEDGEAEYIGKMQLVALGRTEHVVAVMIPAGDYRAPVKAAQHKTAAVLLIVAAFIFAAAFWGSKRYITPIVKDLERIKDGGGAEQVGSRVLEIGDLFAFLAQQDQEHEAALTALHREKQEASGRLDHLQNELRQVSREYQSAQREISRLAYARTQEVDPDEFRFFSEGIHRLTPAEAKIFALYLDGKSAKEIIAALGITENTLKFHNKNIYNKLGVTSRKQMLRYAALMKQREKEGSQTNARREAAAQQSGI